MTGTPTIIPFISAPPEPKATTAVQSCLPRTAVVADPLEAVIRPIVEGQLRGFVKEHPGVLHGVTWYKGSKHGQVATFVNSIAKRVVRDLVCKETRSRIEDALFVIWEAEKSAVEVFAAADGAIVGKIPDDASNAPVQVRGASERGSAGIVAGRSAALLPPVNWGDPVWFNAALHRGRV